MAGRPGRAALIKTIAAAGGEEAVLAKIEAGKTITAIAEELGVSRPMLSEYLNRSDDSVERLGRARETSAHALVEEALAIADSATHDDDRAKRLQVSMRQWLAGKRNRAQYGETPLVAMQVNMGDLVLDALKQPPPPRPQHLVDAFNAMNEGREDAPECESAGGCS